MSTPTTTTMNVSSQRSLLRSSNLFFATSSCMDVLTNTDKGIIFSVLVSARCGTITLSEGAVLSSHELTLMLAQTSLWGCRYCIYTNAQTVKGHMQVRVIPVVKERSLEGITESVEM